MNTDLLVICLTAFIAVFALLSSLAVAMRLLIMVYPRSLIAANDPALLAAVTTALSTTYPGTTVTKIKEIR